MGGCHTGFLGSVYRGRAARRRNHRETARKTNEGHPVEVSFVVRL